MSRTRTISNSDDVIDSRDIIARIAELEGEYAELEGDAQRSEWDDDYGDELAALKALAEEGENSSDDWPHGATLVRESYFVDYVVIDWQATADNLESDYTHVDYDGVTYLVR